VRHTRKKPPHFQAHLVFPLQKADTQKPKELELFLRSKKFNKKFAIPKALIKFVIV
jgi:hypothetical protein